MSKYKISWMEDKTWEGKVKSKASLKDESGAETTDVTIKGDFPGYKDLLPGSTVNGVIASKEYNGKMYKFLNEEKTDTSNPSAPAWAKKKGNDISKVMDRKEQHIDKTLDRKENNMEKFAAFRDATLMTTAWCGSQYEVSEELLKEMWERMHAWLQNKLEQPF